ncbi:hypothetical protein, partial [Myxococcus sp. AM011]|uniref:hypothetical protein n=1 Tax=Myxococcus sp. AM011 TaxID=2745200 RepID=UPI001C3CA3FA
QGVARENVADDSGARAEQQLGLLKDARFLVSLREELVAEEDRLAKSRMGLARQYMAEGDHEDSSKEEEP